MSDSEREIILVLAKIYNWSSQQKQQTLLIQFFSALTQSCILSKMVKGQIVEGEFVMNCSLKITYFLREREVDLSFMQIVIRMGRREGEKDRGLAADIFVDLEILRDKKTMFFGFGEKQQMLKIMLKDNSRNDSRQRSITPKIKSTENSNFIQQREDFLKRINHKKEENYIQQDQNQKRSFSQKIRNLLKQTRNLRNQKLSIGRIGEYNININEQYYCNPNHQSSNTRYIDQRSQYNVGDSRQMRKSYSQNHLIPHRKSKMTERTKQKTVECDQRVSRRHRLLLKDLQVVSINDNSQDSEPFGWSGVPRQMRLMAVKQSIRSQYY